MSDETKAIDDKATTPEPAAATDQELTDKDLGQVAGGAMAQDVTVNKSKAALKSSEAVDALIRG